ncbi:MAG: transposase [Phycisphaerae bacterium]|nr:transposase [Phycisphaerae bacterium]
MKNERKKYRSEGKMQALRQHFVEKVPVSDVCDRHGIHPSLFYRWQKELFEKGTMIFEPRDDARNRHLEAKIAALTTKLAGKDEVIAEIMASHVQLKKSLGQA